MDSLFEIYLLTGGIPATINELKETDKISTRLFNVYINAIIGNLHRYGYKEHYFKQIVREIFNSLSNPISWNSFTKHTEVRSHNTVQDYITALEELYIANISYRCTIHDHRIHTFSKKIYIQDPFIFHALHGWSNNKKNYFTNAKANILDLEMKSKLIEGIVYSHLCRLSFWLNPRDLFDPKDNICYYRDKNGKEIDRNHTDDAECPVGPLRFKQGIVGTIMHKGNHTHPHVTQADIRRPLRETGVCCPCNPCQKYHDAHEERDFR